MISKCPAVQFVTGEVGKGGRGRMEGEISISIIRCWKGGRGGRKGMESEWSRQTCQLHITPAFKTFSSGKVIVRWI